MALHVRTALSDACGEARRTCRYYSHSGGGTPADYVQELSKRFALLRIDP
jgi:hypothetical protein